MPPDAASGAGVPRRGRSSVLQVPHLDAHDCHEMVDAPVLCASVHGHSAVSDLKESPEELQFAAACSHAVTHHRFLENPQTHKCPTPTGEGGGYWTPTHPPTYPPNYHRQNAFGADPKSPTMAYPTGGGEGGVGTRPWWLALLACGGASASRFTLACSTVAWPKRGGGRDLLKE